MELEDKVLGKKVPSIVFIQNQKLLKDAFKNELTNDARARKALRVQAQVNDYLFTMMRRNGIALQMDENIGTAFITDLETIGTGSRRPSKSIRSTVMTVTETATAQDWDGESTPSKSEKNTILEDSGEENWKSENEAFMYKLQADSEKSS